MGGWWFRLGNARATYRNGWANSGLLGGMLFFVAQGGRMYDIAIIGAGPAGSTLARLVSPHLKVLLIDGRRPGEAAKLCGGLLAPAAQKELARQHLGVPSHVLEGPQLFAVRAVDAAAGIEATYQRHYLNVDRGRFDRWLLSLVSTLCDIRSGWTLDRVERHGVGSMLHFRLPDGGGASAPARVLIGADGATSTVRRLLFPGAQIPRYVAIQAEFETNTTEATYGALFDERLTDFYGWTVPKAGSLLAGCAFRPQHGVMDRFDRCLEAMRAEGMVTGVELSRRAIPLLRPSRAQHVRLAGENAMLLGEAAGLISPSSAEGVSYALRSAAACAEALVAGVDGAPWRYRSLATPLLLEVLGKTAKSRVLYGAGARRMVMRSGIGAVREGAPTIREALAEVLVP